MKRQYLVRIDKDADSDWGASVPDLPGCVATGKTIDVALRRIEGAIELHLRGLREDGIRVPPPAAYVAISFFVAIDSWQAGGNFSLLP